MLEYYSVEKGLIDIIPASRRETRDLGWLQTHWLFSFDDYFDPENVEFGVLRVFNDDAIASGKGFPAHRHSEMEIVTLVLQGQLVHRDSAGNEGFLKEGEVQRMSAGTGVLHSELNKGKEPLHIYQLWFLPDRGGLKPSYQQGSFPFSKWTNALLPLVSGLAKEGALTMSSPATVYGGALEAGRRSSSKGGRRKLFIYMTSGDLTVDDKVIGPGDQVRTVVNGELVLSSEKGARFVLIELPE